MTVEWQILTPDSPYVDALVELGIQSFLRNPLEIVFGITYDDLKPYFIHLVRYVSTTGLSLIAVDSETKDLVSYCINHDYTADYFMPPNCPGLQLIVDKVVDLEHAWQADQPGGRVAPGHVYHIILIGTHEKYTKQGHARRGIKESIDLAKSKGYKQVLIEYTSQITKAVCAPFGFSVRHTLSYNSVKAGPEFLKVLKDYPNEQMDIADLDIS